MGYGRESMNLTLSLWKDGLFENFESVIELGSQDLKLPPEEMSLVFNRILGVAADSDQTFTPEMFYKGLGFKRYNCIDADGVHNALIFDLNKDIVAENGFREQFNLVTNHGTSEHCFDQKSVFRNVHNLCATGGVMIHALPFQGYMNHGFFNYQPCFYRSLAAANNYRLLGLYLSINSDAGDISVFSESLMRHLTVPPNSTMMLLAVFQKCSDDEFRVPYDGKYLSTSGAIRGEYDTFTKIPSGFLVPNQFEIVEGAPTRQLARLLKQRLLGKLRRTLASLAFWKG
jgi:hypothetical protein